MSPNLTYLVTGANRGIGKGFVSTLLQQPSTTVIAAVRDPSKKSSEALANLPKATGSKLITVKLDSAVESDAFDAVSHLQKVYGITSLDVVIANAGIAQSSESVIKNSSSNVLEHFSVNTIGPLTLLQATAPLLKASQSGRPTFVAISSMAGTIGGMEMLQKYPVPVSPYGASKAALNWFIRKVHFEESWLISFVFHPGLVSTDMTAVGIEGEGLNLKELDAVSPEESATAMLKKIDSATREISGTFQNYDGNILPW